MSNKSTWRTILSDTRDHHQCVCINKSEMRSTLEACLCAGNLDLIRQCITACYEDIAVMETFPCARDKLYAAQEASNIGSGDATETISSRKATLLADLQQIIHARTITRSTYYIQRVLQGISSTRSTDINDINLNRWKEYDDVLTDSLWIINNRDRTGMHSADYWGNFIPQIPYQMLMRYTKAGDWVLDAFAGSGTTLIECRRLGRHGVGIELSPEVATASAERLSKAENANNVNTSIVVGDSTQLDFQELLRNLGIPDVQLLIMHPPYHDIIHFSEDGRDLSNAPTVDDFIQSFREVVHRTYPILEKGRHLIVVIGDKYTRGEWIPLGFYAMQAVMQEGYTLKSIIVKNYEQTKAKRDQKQLWRYRALVGGFYIFKHEYIYIFIK